MILKKIKEKDESFSLIKYLGGDEEKYFEVLQQWKTDFEKDYLEKYPHLHFAPIRHTKYLMKKRRLYLRLIFNFLRTIVAIVST